MTPSGPHAALALLYDARAAVFAWSSVMTLVGELLADIGERWARGQLTVADEHVAAVSLRRALATIADAIPVSAAAPQCLLASAEGERPHARAGAS